MIFFQLNLFSLLFIRKISSLYLFHTWLIGYDVHSSYVYVTLPTSATIALTPLSESSSLASVVSNQTWEAEDKIPVALFHQKFLGVRMAQVADQDRPEPGRDNRHGLIGPTSFIG